MSCVGWGLAFSTAELFDKLAGMYYTTCSWEHQHPHGHLPSLLPPACSEAWQQDRPAIVLTAVRSRLPLRTVCHLQPLAADQRDGHEQQLECGKSVMEHCGSIPENRYAVFDRIVLRGPLAVNISLGTVGYCYYAATAQAGFRMKRMGRHIVRAIMWRS